MYKYIKITIVATVVCFLISVLSFSFTDKTALSNISWTKNVSWFGPKFNDFVEFKISEEIDVTNEDEFVIYLVGGSVKIRPSQDGAGRLIVDTQVRESLNLTLENFYKVDGKRKIIYLAHDENHMNPTDKNSYNIKDIQNLVSSSKHADVILELPVDVNSIEVYGVSADIEILGKRFNTTTINNVSGHIKISQTESESLNLNTISGEIKCESCVTKKVKVNTVSGDVELVIADDTKYKVDFSSISGELKGVSRVDLKSENFIEFNSVSADLLIN